MKQLLLFLLSVQFLGCVSEVDVYVQNHKKECVGVGPRACQQQRASPDEDWTHSYAGIENFEYQWGYDYHLLISDETISNPPADGSSVERELIEVVKKTKFEGEFTIEISRSESLSKENGNFSVLGRQLSCNADNCEELDTFIASPQKMSLVMTHPQADSEPLNLSKIILDN